MTLASYLEKHTITATAFAEKIGVSQVTVSRYLNGKRFPDKATILRIQEATNNKVRPSDWFVQIDPARVDGEGAAA